MEKAEEKNSEEKKSFLRVLKHQLKGPLTVTKGYLSFWETETYKKFPEEKQREFILKSLDGAKRLDYMLNDAFTTLRLREKEVTPLIEAFNVKELVESLVERIQKNYQDKEITLSVTIPEGLEELNTGKTSYATIIEKIIDNAYKFTEKGEITVTVEQHDGKTTIRVTDTGKGFSPEEMKQAFTPLFHGALSMFVMKGLAEDVLQGKLELVSEGTDKGSTFTVTIPNTLN
jgi:signal transduction histidine kinase